MLVKNARLLVSYRQDLQLVFVILWGKPVAIIRFSTRSSRLTDKREHLQQLRAEKGLAEWFYASNTGIEAHCICNSAPLLRNIVMHVVDKGVGLLDMMCITLLAEHHDSCSW